jgi:hypothetical protein
MCPLLFGIKDRRTYYTFRLEEGSQGGIYAHVYQIKPRLNADSGFDPVSWGDTKKLPYVNRWDIINPWQSKKTKLAIHAKGQYYQFFVNDRLVIERQIDGEPLHVVAVGVTALTRANTACNFEDVSLRRAP